MRKTITMLVRAMKRERITRMPTTLSEAIRKATVHPIMSSDIAVFGIRIKHMNRFVVAFALLLMTLTSLSPSVAAFDIEDPQTAERKWATPNLKKIQENYDGPKLSKEEAGDTTILITFILHPSGRIQDLKAVKKSGAFYNKSDIPQEKFNAIQKGLVKAIKKSEPLYYRKRPHETKIPWGVLFVYCPKEYQFARMIHVARGKDGVWGERKRGIQR
ncbi:MAG TPA: hypothetical protein PKD05_17420 [Candidatus Melainabacteria bacterium]|nr:hypothetical protein [Candidatus Melainabacteria bacterium]HMP53333.1 hypothetical protein [Candidatus Melainabacteria bacterium]